MGLRYWAPMASAPPLQPHTTPGSAPARPTGGAGAGSAWLHGPLADYTLGGGLVYVPLLLALALWGPRAGLPPTLLALLILAFNTPHLGATLLRVYERGEDRRAYAFFAVWCTLAIAVAFAVGLWVVPVGSLLITLYLTVVPWHFTGQNYGISLVFLRRRGIDVDPGTKRALYVSFVSTYLMAVVALHGLALSEAYAPLDVRGTVYSFLSLGIPGVVQAPLLLGLAAVWIFSLTTAVSRLREKASWRELAPSLSLCLTQSLWYAVPVLLPFFVGPEARGPFSPENHALTFVWVSQVHGIQYLWITTYYVERQQPGRSRVDFLLKSVLAGSALYGIPALLLAPNLLGRLPYESGLFLMLAGALNVHHVLLDSAIWKLRNGRIARILLRPGESAAAAPEAAPTGWAPWRGLGWARPLVWTSGAVGVLLAIGGAAELQFGFMPSAEHGDLAAMERSAERLRWLGRDGPSTWAAIGARRAELGDVQGGLEALERSNTLAPNAQAWLNIGVLRERKGLLAEAREAYEAAVDVDPGNATALYYAGHAALQTGDRARAGALLEKAARLAPDRPEIRRALERTRGARGEAARAAAVPSG